MVIREHRHYCGSQCCEGSIADDLMNCIPRVGKANELWGCTQPFGIFSSWAFFRNEEPGQHDTRRLGHHHIHIIFLFFFFHLVVLSLGCAVQIGINRVCKHSACSMMEVIFLPAFGSLWPNYCWGIGTKTWFSFNVTLS